MAGVSSICRKMRDGQQLVGTAASVGPLPLQEDITAKRFRLPIQPNVAHFPKVGFFGTFSC